jgi:hypothetical protein
LCLSCSEWRPRCNRIERFSTETTGFVRCSALKKQCRNSSAFRFCFFDVPASVWRYVRHSLSRHSSLPPWHPTFLLLHTAPRKISLKRKRFLLHELSFQVSKLSHGVPLEPYIWVCRAAQAPLIHIGLFCLREYYAPCSDSSHICFKLYQRIEFHMSELDVCNTVVWISVLAFVCAAYSQLQGKEAAWWRIHADIRCLSLSLCHAG